MYELKKMTVGEILDNAFKVLSSNLLPLLVLNAAIMVPLFILNFLVISVAINNGSSLVQGLGIAFTMLSLLVVQPLASGASTKLIADRYLGAGGTVSSSFKYVFRILLPLLGALLLATLLITGGFILLILPGIYLTVRLSLISQSCVVEGRGGGTALSRSMELTKGCFWKFFGIFIVLAGLGIMVEYGLKIVLTPGTVSHLFAYWGFQILLAGYGSCVWVVAYLERRCDLEAFDLEMLAQALDD
ncbi:MAG: hypothetical protein HQ519_12845 [Planctomycetes bacterium]|nr:hypothetical protein [Planctomycetota bacterium]